MQLSGVCWDSNPVLYQTNINLVNKVAVRARCLCILLFNATSTPQTHLVAECLGVEPSITGL